jgi:hypothetical protein
MPLRAAYTAAAAPAGPAPDDQHVKRCLRIQARRLARLGLHVELGDDLFQRHPAGAEHLAVQVDHRDGHHLALVHLRLVQGAIDHHRLDARVDDGHQRHRLHHVRAVVAGQGHVDLEAQVAVQTRGSGRSPPGATLGGCPPVHSSASTSDVNSWPSGMAAKRTPVVSPSRATTKDGLRLSVPDLVETHLVRQAGDVLQQRAQFGRLGARIERGNQADRALQFAQVGLELGFHGGIKHGDVLGE